MRVTALFLAVAIFAAPAFAEKKEKSGPVFEPNTYRFGGTYSVTSVLSASQCSTACGRDTRCLSWSFVDTIGAAAKNSCELKSIVGRSETNPTSTSGVSPRIERDYQPSPYRHGSALLGASNQSSGRTTRQVRNVPAHQSAQTQPRRTTTVQRASIPSTTPKSIAAPAAPATISSGAPKRIAAPAAPAKIYSQPSLRRAAPPAPATISADKPTLRKAPAAPAVISSSIAKTQPPSSTPIAVNTPANPSVKPATPQVQFQPLKRSADGTYRPTAAKPAPRPQTKTSRVVLTGPTGADVAKSETGRVVLTGDLGGTTGGGVGETPAAPIPRNVPVSSQGERTPYKDLSSRDYPDYSVTRAAEDGGIEQISGEAGS